MRGLGRVVTLEDIGNIVIAVKNSVPVLVKDVGHVEIGYAPRLGQFGFNKQNDAVEGIILMRTGEQAQVVLKRVEAKTRELNDHVLPKDVKVLPFYDRSDLIALTTRTVADNLVRGIVLVVIVLIFFLYDIRSGLIVAVTVPLALLIAFICLDLRNIPANLLSIGAIDFGILVDGAVVMVENIYRQLARRHGTEYRVERRHLRRRVGGEPADRLRDRGHRRRLPADLRAHRPVGKALPADGRHDDLSRCSARSLLTLTVIPVLCVVGLAEGREGAAQPRVRVDSRPLCERVSIGVLHNRAPPSAARVVLFAVSLVIAYTRGGEFMPKLDEGALWVRATMPYTISFEESSTDRAADSRRSSRASPKSPSLRRSTAATTPAPTRRASSMPSSTSGSSRTATGTARITSKDAADRRDQQEAVGLPGHHLQLHAAGRRRGRRSAHRPQGVARREGVRHRPRHPRSEGTRDQGRHREGPGHQTRHARAGARSAEPDDHRRSREDGALRA